uniref:Zinc finger PHD-type domain-containing protein n=1 Tax=Ananas comosus var. bracteatus TaxID=296719 RepID=A0A6V7NMM9_ANACO|nr:unnamed protein product [Ananas comosus var. bracteatus]
MGRRRCSCRITTISRVPTPSRASALSTASRSTPSSMPSAMRTSSAASSTNRPLGASCPTGSPCFASVRCLTNRMTFMIQCEECSDWYHPSCVGMKIEEAKKLEHFFCESCSPENGKKSEKSHSATRQTEQKVDSKRRRR